MARKRMALAVVAVIACACGAMEGGELVPPGPPNDATSARFTLGDVWNRLNSGAAGTKRGATFVQPVAGPHVPTMRTTDEIMAAAPTADNAAGATVGEVASGKTFWGLRTDGTWGPKTGTLSTRTPSATTTAQQGGIYPAFDLAVVDPNLAAGNIKTGTTIFGVSGTAIASTGDALAANVLTRKTFSNATAAGIAGTMANNAAVTITPGTTAQTIAAGYHNGSGTVAGDANLVTGNIRSGTTIFGVSGNTNVVNTSSGTATAADILSGKTAWVAGTEITGTGTGGGSIAAGVPKTGQTTCYDASNVLTTCPGTPLGQDGELKKGVAYPNPRFTINMKGTPPAPDGTVTDNMTGLIWLANANCLETVGGISKAGGTLTWVNAMNWSNGLASGACGLTDGSTAGQWRLPNVREQQSLIDYNYANPAVPNTLGTGKWTAGDPFTNVTINFYWTSSTYVINPASAWYVNVNSGYVNYLVKASTNYVWPVRGGQ